MNGTRTYLPGTQRLARKVLVVPLCASTICARFLWLYYGGPGALFLPNTPFTVDLVDSHHMHQVDYARLRPNGAAIAYYSITLRLLCYGLRTHPCRSLIPSVQYPLNSGFVRFPGIIIVLACVTAYLNIISFHASITPVLLLYLISVMPILVLIPRSAK